MNEFDLYDFFGHHGYHARALKRSQRGELYISNNALWFNEMDSNAAIVLRGFGKQFSSGGTDALETPTWEVPEIRQAGGLAALKDLGIPGAVLRDAKERLFSV